MRAQADERRITTERPALDRQTLLRTALQRAQNLV